MSTQEQIDAIHKDDGLMGPVYPYHKYVRAPSALGMSSKGSLSQIGKNVNGLVEYVSLLVSGNSKASATGRPLGNKFFLNTGAKCTDPTTGEEQERYVYINNVPMGNIPLISAGAGVNFTEFRGLIPGTLSNLNALNPAGLLRAFTSGASPECQPLTMETIDIENRISTETQYVTLADVRGMDPCNFSGAPNPETGQRCVETFGNATASASQQTQNRMLFYAGCAIVVGATLYWVTKKKRSGRR